uniref:BTB/POZ domain-containing protein n=2 Tax=Chenopodium quinoa TaxID=63459 RepID=A0A803LRY9_CHEQI
MSLLFTWFTMWALRLVSDVIPTSSSLFSSLNHRKITSSSNVMVVDHHGDGHGDGSSSAAAALTSVSYSPVQNLDLISHDGFLIEGGGDHHHRLQAGLSVEALSRALSHILALLNELPATSKKYEFAVAMADRLLDDNTRDGNVELLHVNSVALSSAFECTVNRLYHILNNAAISHVDQANNRGGPWTLRVIRKLPLGTYISAYMKGGISAVFPHLHSMWQLQKRRSMMNDDGDGGGDEFVGSDQSAEVVGAEKLAQELLWIIHKLRACYAVDEALVQWSLASNLASLSLNANPRVQALLIKISASLLGDIAQAEFKVHTQVQYRLLVLWLPLFCYACSGLRYPVLSSYEKIDVERTMERMIASLSATEQEVVLRNWLQDFAICSSDWPNLRPSYDRWCQCSRQLVA